MRGLSTMITSRRQLVKQYVLISSQREEKERELNDPSSGLNYEMKVALEQRKNELGIQLKEIRNAIRYKYNQNIERELKNL
jgi:chaperonin cofactor prefoldin